MAGTPDNRTPGVGGQETHASETLTPNMVNGLRDRYLKALGLEGARQVQIGNSDGSFIQFSTTPEGDAWSLVTRTPGIEFGRYSLGIIPIKEGPYAEAKQPTTELIEGISAAFAFKGFLDERYPEAEPETEGTPDGHAPTIIKEAANGSQLIDPEDADRLITARADIRRTIIERIEKTDHTVELPTSTTSE